LLIDPGDRLLLLKANLGSLTVWLTPGGGLELGVV
jgi:hypothetical protein